MIPRKLAALFLADVRARGETYVAGRVRLIRADPATIVATATGTDAYTVAISAEGGELAVRCSCPYAADRGACKHGWATLRVADDNGKLAPLLATAGPHPGFRFYAGFDDPSLNGDDVRSTRATTLVRPRTGAGQRPFGSNDAANRAHRQRGAKKPEWKRLFEDVREQLQHDTLLAQLQGPTPATWPEDRRLVYVVDLDATLGASGVVVNVNTEKRGRDGTWSEPKGFGLGAAVWFSHPDPRDRQIAQMLVGASTLNPYGMAGFERSVRTSGFVIPGSALGTTLRLICETERCLFRVRDTYLPGPVRWDDGPPWQFRLRMQRTENGAFSLSGVLRREDEEMPLAAPLLLHPGGVLFTESSAAHFDHGGAFPLVRQLRGKPAVAVADGSLVDLLDTVESLPHSPPVELPPDTGLRVEHAEPVPYLSIQPDPDPGRARDARVGLSLAFQYGGARTPPDTAGRTLFDRDAGILYYRDETREAEARRRLVSLGAKEEEEYAGGPKRLVLLPRRVPSLVAAVLRTGWRVDALGARYRAPGAVQATVRSGIDWFDLDGTVSYDDFTVPLATILEASRRGEDTLTLEDGSVALLPDEWLTRAGALAMSGEQRNGVTRFRISQVALLDALLDAVPEVDVDAACERARAELRSFDRVQPARAPQSFRGTLRDYQREALGWFDFLRRFGLGGCLADDMGLGKTVQVLALLEARRLENAGTSIVVVPRSLVFNWKREAERFTPELRVLDHSGAGRRDRAATLDGVDLVITTYGTLRRDAESLAAVEFDYAILDEAQAIKNARTASAKAARVLRARHRLALSGTPIENRIEELWSLFEFLNPGMLGSSLGFAALVRHTAAVPDEHGRPAPAAVAGRELLSRALRPVILRRTKEKVASELPPRVEQTLEVELESPQRAFYDGLRKTYRESLLARVDRDGIRRARMHILEALLRLRQAACHPVLADPSRAALPSAKLDALLPALGEIVAEGHKALVFSQFTSFLALVRERLDQASLTYEYLDGKTRDRQARVDRFQSDPACSVFLISLKAGGHGLNLTSADYVYLLDPWWNPAVEAQAIDRTHRIGQTRHVIATRLVARGTIEEKILELQASKRSLADAILSADAGVLASIGRQELELLLG